MFTKHKVFENLKLSKITVPLVALAVSFLYVCMVNTIYLLSFVETPRKFIIAELSIRKLGSSSVLTIGIISTDEDPSLRIESSAIINLRGVFTKLNKYSTGSVQDTRYKTRYNIQDEVKEQNSTYMVMYYVYELHIALYRRNYMSGIIVASLIRLKRRNSSLCISSSC